MRIVNSRKLWYNQVIFRTFVQKGRKSVNRHENQTMKIFGKRLTAGLLGAALVMSMPFASALTQKNITVGRGVTIYVDDRKINPGDANGNPVEPMLYNGTTYLPIRAVSAALNVPIAWDGTTSSAYLADVEA